jgi:hypothetical protein
MDMHDTAPMLSGVLHFSTPTEFASQQAEIDIRLVYTSAQYLYSLKLRHSIIENGVIICVIPQRLPPLILIRRNRILKRHKEFTIDVLSHRNILQKKMMKDIRRDISSLSFTSPYCLYTDETEHHNAFKEFKSEFLEHPVEFHRLVSLDKSGSVSPFTWPSGSEAQLKLHRRPPSMQVVNFVIYLHKLHKFSKISCIVFYHSSR